MAVAQKVGVICLVTYVCLTSAILTAKEATRPTVTPHPWRSYLPVASVLSPKRSHYVVHVDHAVGNVLENPASSEDSRAERFRGLQAASTSSSRQQKSPTNIRHRLPAGIQRDEVWPSTEVPSPSPPTTMRTTTSTTSSRPRDAREYQGDVPRRFSYQDIEEVDGYQTHELDDGKLPYRGKAESTYHRRGPQDITTAIKALDRFLSETLNADSYNSQLHPPPNPVLALVLSRYGRYVPGIRNPRVYAYTAVNNMHNNKPFGIYKYECDEQPIYAVR